MSVTREPFIINEPRERPKMTELILAINNDELKVSSETIAKSINIQHKNILESIRKHKIDFEVFGSIAFETRKGKSLLQGGFAKSTEYALLNEQQAYLLLTYCRNTEIVRQFKIRLVKEYSRLKNNQSKIPQTFAEALQLAADQQKEIERKDQLIIASNEASIKAGEILVREFVKSNDLIDIGEKKFWQWMREQKLVSETNEPYQIYVTRGYFTFKPSDEEINGKFRYTLRITPRGKIWLANKWLNYIDEFGV